LPDNECPYSARWRFLYLGWHHMRPIHKLYISSAGCDLALTVATGACAQQSTPVSTSSTPAPADNSGVNMRDRSSQTMTPADQPNDKADIKLAAAVRRAVVNDKTLSMSAHNIKLIAANGVVTLRGPVASEDEKAKLEADVRGVPGVSRVDNQLDVKTP
jgi:osmotically-inducible protein OsmY